jgi:predicted nucleic acid-binding protein
MPPDTRYIFLDANIYVQYLPYFRAEVLLKKLEHLNLIVCGELINEIRRVAFYPGIIRLTNPANQNNYHDYVQAVLLKIQQFADINIVTPIPILIEQPAGDSGDWYITNLCLQYNCTLVTADKHFLKWEQPPFPVVSPADFFSRL